MTYLALAIVWWLLGSIGYVYWWTREYDLRLPDQIGDVVIFGLLGLVAWIAGAAFHGHGLLNPKTYQRRGRILWRL